LWESADGQLFCAGQAEVLATLAANTESLRSTSMEAHFAQAVFSWLFFTSFSNSAPHFPHLYSNIGIIISFVTGLF
jgi:hypothetical protein